MPKGLEAVIGDLGALRVRAEALSKQAKEVVAGATSPPLARPCLVRLERESGGSPVRLTLTNEGWKARSDEIETALNRILAEDAIRIAQERMSGALSLLAGPGAARDKVSDPPTWTESRFRDVQKFDGLLTVEMLGGLPTKVTFAPGVSAQHRWGEISHAVVTSLVASTNENK